MKMKKKKTEEKPRNEELLAAITPVSINFKNNVFSLGENYCRIYGIIKYPPETNLGWLAKLTEIPNTIVSISIRKLNQGDFSQAMSKSVENNRASALGTHNELERIRNVKAAEDATRIMESIENESEAVAGFGLEIMVLAPTLEELNEKCQRVLGTANALGCRARLLSFLQQDAFKNLAPSYPAQPNASDVIERPFLLSTFVGGFPFAKNTLCDPEGYYFGRNSAGSLIMFDPWLRDKSHPNSNITVLGDAGTGKSTTLKHIVISEIARGTKVIIIDPEGEYKDICLSPLMNGKWIDVAGGRGGIINPLQVRPAPRDDPDEGENSSQIADLAIHLKTLKTFFSLYIPSLTEKHHAVLEKVLIELYQNFGITWNTDVSKKINEQFPTFSDLYALIKSKAETAKQNKNVYADLELYLASAAEGADKGLWNGVTTVRNDNDCIVLDTKSVMQMGGGVLAAQYFNILTWCWEQISRKKGERVMLIADEVWMLIDPKCPQSLEFMRNAEKRARKYDGSIVVASQQIVDFLDPAVKLYGQSVLDQPTIKILFGMNGQGLKEATDLFALNEAQTRLISSGRRGIALMAVGANKFRINFEFSKERLRLFGTGGGR